MSKEPEKSLEQIRDEMAEDWFRDDLRFSCDQEIAFKAGWNACAPIVEKRTIEMVLGLLREQSFRNNLTCHQWADWLEKELLK